METPQEQQPELEILENKFYEGEAVSWKGESGWKIDGVAEKNGKQILEIGRMRKDPKGRDVYETQIAYAHELAEQEVKEPELEILESKFYEGEQVVWNGYPGWEVLKVIEKNGSQFIEIGRKKLAGKTAGQKLGGKEIYETQIVKPEELQEVH